MTMTNIAAMGAGFTDSSFGSQAVFRSALHALSHPGECVRIVHDAETPSLGHSASAALLLALLDPDCKLWLSPSLASSDAVPWLRFHTGCVIVDEPNAAQFAWVAFADELPPLDAFPQGTDTYPDQSATCIVEVAAMTNDESSADWVLTGPGIRAQRSLRIEDSPNGFVGQWARNQDRFPRGVDMFFVVEEQIVGLPRTTRISSATKEER